MRIANKDANVSESEECDWLERRDYGEDVAAFQKAIALDPKNPENWCALGWSLYQLGIRGSATSLEDAGHAFRHAVDLDPKDATSWGWLGLTLRRLGACDESDSALQKATLLHPGKDSSRWDWVDSTFVRLGQAYYGLKAYAQARVVCEHAVKVDPKNAENWYWLGRAQFELEAFEAARDGFHRAVDLAPDDPDNWYWLGCAHFEQEVYDQARDAFQRAVDLAPDDPENWRLGLAHYELEEYGEARTVFQKAVDLDPKNAVHWLGLGGAFCKLERYGEAQAALQKAVELNPKNPDNWYWLGRTLYGLRAFEDAVPALRKATELDSEDSRLWFWLGRAIFDCGTYEEAIPPLKRAVDLSPSEADSWFWLGQAHFSSLAWEEATIAYRRALDLNLDPSSRAIARIQLAECDRLKPEQPRSAGRTAAPASSITPGRVRAAPALSKDPRAGVRRVEAKAALVKKQIRVQDEALLDRMQSATTSLEEGRYQHAAQDAWWVVEMLLKVAYEQFVGEQCPRGITNVGLIDKLKPYLPAGRLTADALHRVRKLRNKLHPSPTDPALAQLTAKEAELMVAVAQQLCYWLGVALDQLTPRQAQVLSEPMEEVCLVCNFPLKPTERVVTTPCCETVFHYGHLTEWIRTNGTCPKCRTGLTLSRGQVRIV